MSVQVVIPSIEPSWTRACLDSCRIPEEQVLVVDNTALNRGVAGSWNLGIDAMRGRGAQWLIICSAAVRFGELGGLDFLAHLACEPGAHAVEAGDGIGWHLLAFNRHVIETVGRFDENLYPAYYEDIDYSRRMQLAYGAENLRWPKVDVDAKIAGVAHGITVAHVHVDFVGGENYYCEKWGGCKHEEAFPVPFDEPGRDWTWWPTPPDPRCFMPDDRPLDVPWGSP